MSVVAPFLVPQFDALIVALLLLCGFIVAAGIVYVLHGFVRATVGGIAGLLGKIPGVGFIVASPVNAVYHWMNAEFSAVEQALDRRISSYFHQLARLVAWVGEEIAAHANLLYLLSTILLGSTITESLRLLIRLARTEIAALRGTVTHLHRAVVRPLVGELHGLERWTYPRVRHALHEVDVAIPRDIAGLRARTRAIEDLYDAAWSRLKGLEARFGADVFAGAVAVALTTLGLEWLRCSSLGRLGKRIGCGGFGLIDEVFAASVIGFAAADLCDFAAAAQAVAEEMVPVLMELVDVEDALLGCHGATGLPAFALETLTLPPNPLGLSLAA